MTELTNRDLLAINDDRLIGSIDRQRQYILRQHAQKKPCPNCATPLDYFQAAGVDVDAIDLKKGDEQKFACPACKRGLNHTLPMLGDWHWSLIPIDL